MKFQELIDAYTVRLDEYFKDIDNMCRSNKREGKQQPLASPSYLYEVIMPIYDSLAEMMRRNPTMKVPDPKTYQPIKEFYRIKVGLTTVGGFSVPDGEDFSIYFTPLKHALPNGERVKVEDTEQLCQLIINQYKFLKHV